MSSPSSPSPIPRPDIHLPRTKLPIGYAAALAPHKKETYFNQPNPSPDRSGVYEAITAAGGKPAPISILRVIIGIIFGSIGIAATIFALMSLKFFGRSFSLTGGLPIFFFIFMGVGVMFAIVGHRLAWSAVGFSRRFRTAWDNGWITFRPVLIGQVCLERTVSQRDSDDHSSTVTYYYTAPVQILNPDGSMTQAVTEEFILGRKPSALRRRGFAVADDIESAIVDFSHNNGWAVAGLNLHDTSPAPELHNQLHRAQEEAVLTLAESSWAPQADASA